MEYLNNVEKQIKELSRIKPGERVVYFRGNLAEESFYNEGAAQLKDNALNMYMIDKVNLTQKKIFDIDGKSFFEYVATGKTLSPDSREISVRNEYFNGFLKSGVEDVG